MIFKSNIPMITSEANIEITRHDGVLHSISAVMPVWNKTGEDDIIAVNIPLFGMKTFATDEADVDIAIEEAIKCFCIASEKFGNGLNQELVDLGWTAVENEKERISLDYNIPDDNFVFEQLMQTGEQYAHADLEFA